MGKALGTGEMQEGWEMKHSSTNCPCPLPSQCVYRQKDWGSWSWEVERLITLRLQETVLLWETLWSPGGGKLEGPGEACEAGGAWEDFRLLWDSKALLSLLVPSFVPMCHRRTHAATILIKDALSGSLGGGRERVEGEAPRAGKSYPSPLAGPAPTSGSGQETPMPHGHPHPLPSPG